MSPENFVYWLNGFFEMTDEYKLTEKQVQMIKNHLKLVFTNVTSQCSEEQQPVVKDIEVKIPESLKKIIQQPAPRIQRYC